ncbi:hypothetical protein ACOME3_010182 [Neoechinorhynchus agilis]
MAEPSSGSFCPFSGRFVMTQIFPRMAKLKPRIRSAHIEELFSIGWPHECPEYGKRDLLTSCDTINNKALLINIDYCDELDTHGSNLNLHG